MIIKTLEFQDFRRFQAQAWELGRVTVFTGDNEAGKTTILDGLEFLFSGLTRTVARTGAGRDHLVRLGGHRAAVTVASETGDTVTRTVPHGLSMSWLPRQVGVDEAQAELERTVGCSGRDAALTLRANRYWSLDEKDQKGLLFSLLGLRTQPNDVRAALEGDEEKFGGRPLVDTAMEVLGQIPADLEYGRKSCYAARTEVNRQHKTAKVRLEEARREAEDIPPATAPDAAELAKARAEYERTHAAVVERETRRRQRVEVEADLAATRQELEQLRARHDEEPGDVATLQQQVRTYEAALTGIQRQSGLLVQQRATRREEARATLTQAERQAATLREQLKRGRCQTCHQELSRGPAREAIETALGALVQQATQARAALDAADPVDSQIAQLEERIRNGRALLRQRQDELAAARQAIRAAEERRASVARAEKRLTQLQDRLAGLPAPDAWEEAQAALARGEVGDPFQDELRDAFEAAKARLEALSDQRAAAERYQAIVERQGRLADEVAETKARSEVLTILVDFFGPEGYQLRLLAEKLDPIVGNLNRILAAWGMEVRYLYPTVDLEVRPRGSDAWIPWQLLSDSSQLCVALAHQVMFAQQTGLRIIGLDRLEAFDAGRQGQLLQACLDLVARSEVDHVVLTGVTLLAPLAEGIRHYHLTQEAA